MLESYSDIPKILRAIEKQCILNNIFISGSMAFDNDSWTIDEAQMFTSKLAQGLVAGGKYITSGYGFGIGGSVITGVLKEAEQRKSAHFDEYLKLYPFPQPEHGTSDAKLDKIWHAYRLNIMEKCGVAIFIFGNKKDEAGKKISASGMRKEWKIAKEKKNILIPIASTDDTALEIYKEMYKEKENYKYLDGYWESLETEKDVEKLVKIVLEIINKAVRCVEVV